LFDITIPTPRGRKTEAQLEANTITVVEPSLPSLLIVFIGVVRHSDGVSASGVGLFATRL